MVIGAGSLMLFVMNEDDRNKNREVLTSAVQKALLSAAKQATGPFRELRVTVGEKTGAIHVFARLLVVEKVMDKHEQISLPDARRIKQHVDVGQELEVDVTPVGFARTAVRSAKQALMDHLRRAEEGLE